MRSKHREISPGTIVFNSSIKAIKKSKDLTWIVQCLPFQPVTQRQVPFLHWPCSLHLRVITKVIHMKKILLVEKKVNKVRMDNILT